LLTIYTDGATEAMNGSDEEFGEDKLRESLEQARAQSPEDIWKHVLSRIGDWQAGCTQSDDITLIVCKTE
jgi:sigma-B regulation protein RsbU (phosphoserine phosphatase)